MYTHVLVPLDGSELAEVALPHAIAAAKPGRATLTLLQVLGPMTAGAGLAGEGMYLDADFWQKLEQDREAEGRAYLAKVRDRLSGEGLDVRTDLRSGPPADTIIEAASELKADLIVMATHGRSGLGRWVLGSVADRVVRASHLPVLLIRPVEASRSS